MDLTSPIEKSLPMSSVQRRLYLQCQLPGGDRAYHLMSLARLRGHFPLTAAEAFASKMIQRHESLRTAFRMIAGEFISEVHAKVDFSFTVIDGKESDLAGIVEAYDKAYELDIPPLFRIVILRLSETDCIGIFNCHHLIFDGYSAGILSKDIGEALAGRELAPLDRTYGDFVEWENSFFQSADYEKQKDFWCRKYREAPQRLNLPADFTALATKSFAGDYFMRYLQLKELKAFSMSQGATIFMTLLAAFYCVIYKLTSQKEITIGTLVSPRESGGFQNVIGLFANTLPLTLSLDPKTKFSSFLQNIQATVFAAMQHADFPFEHLIRQLPFLEAGVRNPLFDIVFNFERVVRGKAETFRDIVVEPVDYYAKVSMFDFSIDIVEYEDQVRFKVEYATKLFREETIQGTMDAYFGIIDQVCREPDILIGDMSLVSDNAREQLNRFNDTVRPLKENRTFLDIWKQQVALNGDNPAVRLGGREITYAQLEEQANRLAHYLIDRKIGTGSVVAVALDRTPQWVVALLAIWKAGAVYLPLAALHPASRIMYQLADSKASLVITQDHLAKKFADFSSVMAIDSLESTLAACPKDEPRRVITATQPAYVIYTSGSTGTPKGVLVDHRAVHSHIDSLKGIYKLQPDDNVLQFSSPTFDASLEQILITLSCGACLVLLDSQLHDPRSLLDLLASEEITVAEFPPAYLKEIAPVLTPYSLRKIKRLISGGDVLTSSLAREITKHLSADAKFLNFYGPTEASMAATVYPVTGNLDQYDSRLSLPIGKPLPNTRIYILDSNNQLLPIGVAGELCIAGDRLAQGYLNREALTAEKFIRLKLMGTEERIYKTGDKARWLLDGNIEFLGRLDNQVQLRGYRIELGEIEQTLLSHPDIRDAIVLKNSDQRENLAAFVVTRSPGSMSARILYEWLKDYLPDYLIPATFSFIDAIPRNAEGKVDRLALTQSRDNQSQVLAHEMPLDTIEWDLWHMWRKILKVPHIGRNDIFFQIGGNSLSAISVMVEVKNKYNVDLPLALLLKAPTIAILADFLRSTDKPVAPSCVVSLNPEGTMPPIVLIPGLGGNVLDMYELSANLDKRFACYGLQHPWDSAKPGIDDSIENLARYYLQELDSAISLEGCILMGHSFGGYVAYELARILQEHKRPAQSLLLLDVVAPQGEPIDRQLSLTEQDLINLTVSTLLGSRESAIGETPEASDADGKQFEKALDVLKAANRVPHSLSVDQFRQYIEMIARRAAAFSHYKPASLIDTDICLYRAREIDGTQGFTQEDGNWAALTRGSFKLQWVPGDHFSMIKSGQAAELAKQIHCDIIDYYSGN